MTIAAADGDLVVVFETHATSLDNEAGLASGWFDVGLSRAGEEQSRQLGIRRRGDELAAVFCSDLARAVRTAAIAFGDTRLPIIRDSRLRECDYGSLTRRPASEIARRRADHVATPFPNGESYQQVVERVSAWVTETATRFSGRTVLVIGHRATHYALEYLVERVSLHDVVSSRWHWQPGWIYRIASRSNAP
jgi:broad specificity phosphatase PhoE